MNEKKSHKLKKEHKIVAAILIVPLLITFYLVWPNTAEFTAPGETVDVGELGVNGNVSFVYVEAGFVSNYYERVMIMIEYADQVEFHPILAEDVAYMEDEDFDPETFDYDQYKRNTVTNAVEIADSYAYSSEVLDDKIKEIMDLSWEYDGDSFGLMVAIGLIEEMSGDDFSQHGSINISGTGTIEEDETVGSVDGVRQKLITAEMNYVDYFFVPEDADRYDDKQLSNQVVAEQTLEEENLSLEVIPVESLVDALLFLYDL